MVSPDGLTSWSGRLQLFSMVSGLFRKRLMKSVTPGLRDALLAAAPGRASEEMLFPLFAEYVLSEHGREIKRYRHALKLIASFSFSLVASQSHSPVAVPYGPAANRAVKLPQGPKLYRGGRNLSFSFIARHIAVQERRRLALASLAAGAASCAAGKGQ